MDAVGSDKKVTLKWIQGDLSHNTITLKPLDKQQKTGFKTRVFHKSLRHVSVS